MIFTIYFLSIVISCCIIWYNILNDYLFTTKGVTLMFDFLYDLTQLQKFFYYIAIPSTVVLAIQTVLTLLGISDGLGDADIDVDMDGDIDGFDVDGMAGFRFFSIRGIISFLTIFGWVGVVLSNSAMHIGVILFLSFLSGLVAMFLVALMFYSMTKLQSSGNIQYKNAIGSTGEVYIPIPANRNGTGKIQITVQGRYIELEAITDSDTVLSTGTFVRVTDIVNKSLLLVEKE